MLRQLSFLFVFLCLSFGLFAQVEVSTSMPTKTYLRYEGIPLRMEITNNSGEVLVLGGEDTDDIFSLRVRDLDNRVIPRTKLPFLTEPWVIPDGETSARVFDLVQLFHLQGARSYRCLQEVKLAGEVYTGSPLMFEVVRGRQEDQIKRRKADRIFTLYSVHRDGYDELLLQVTDYKNTMVLATYLLEKHLKFYDPFMKMNKQGELATLHYLSPNRAVLCRFKADGSAIGRTYYSVSPGVPVRLLEDGNGGFVVQGGVEVKPKGTE